MSDSEKERGAVYLHDPHAIGLQLIAGNIDLHPTAVKSKVAGIRVNVETRHYRANGTSGGLLNIEFLELTIPGANGNYIGRIEGWDLLFEVGDAKTYVPDECQLLPDHTEFVTFGYLDAWDEVDPYFYFGWGQRTDILPEMGTNSRGAVAFHGVNYPIEEYVRPSWVDIPPETELKEMLEPGAPEGQWNLRVRMSGFTVDEELSVDSFIKVRIMEGRSTIYTGCVDFVDVGGCAIGEDDADYSGIFWGSQINPGRLKIKSGTASGQVIRVVGCYNTGDEPQGGYPANTWIIKTHPGDSDPGNSGMEKGDEYVLESPFDPDALTLYSFNETYGPGVYPEQEFDIDFEPVM